MGKVAGWADRSASHFGDCPMCKHRLLDRRNEKFGYRIVRFGRDAMALLRFFSFFKFHVSIHTPFLATRLLVHQFRPLQFTHIPSLSPSLSSIYPSHDTITISLPSEE